jgi:flagellar hook-associated protein 2
MVTQITLGNITTQNGRNVVGGSQSGLDTDSIINSLVDAKRLPAVTLETKNETLDTKKAALTDLKTLLTRFRTAADTLRNPPGVANASANIFQYRTATLSSVLSTSNYLGVAVQPGVNTQSFTVNKIEQLAKETKQSTNIFTVADTSSALVVASGTATAGQMQAGTFELRTLNGGSPVSITLDEGDSLQDVVDKFNALKSSTGIQASVVKISSGTTTSNYKLVLTGTQTGASGGFDLAAATTVTSDPDGVLVNLTFDTSQTAQNAIFQLDGVDVERESNTVSDLVTGVTFTLRQPYSDVTPVTVTVEPDTEMVSNAINQLADIYNELRVFAAQQSQVGDDGLPLEDSVLSNDATMRSIVNSITNEMTAIVNGLSNNGARSLSEIGVSFQDFEGDDSTPRTRNIIVIDADKLSTALSENFDNVRSIFEFSMTSSSSDLAIYRRSNSSTITSFTLNADVTNNSYTATYAGGSVTFEASTISGGSLLLKGPAGTPFEGLEFIFAGSSDTSINVTLSYGIGDRVYNSLNSTLATGGSMETALTQIDDQKTRNTTEITKIDDYLVTYRDQLLNTYSQLEAALTRANQLLSLLDAQANARMASAS